MVLNAKYRISICFSTLTRRYFSVGRRSLFDSAAKDGELRVFIVAGEVSGDSIASRLMSSLKNLSPFPVRFSGIGGSMMCKQGLKSLFPMEDICVMGIWELLPHLYKFRARLKETTIAAILFKPHIVVTVDSKGFSFRFLKQLRARQKQQRLEDCPIHFHYVAPSFWAWKGGESRLGGLAQFVDHLFCILPNEAAVCRQHGLEATFVGHPVLEDALEYNLGKENCSHEWKIEGNRQHFLAKHFLSSGATIISVLPGSRLQEVERMLPMYLRTLELLYEHFPELVSVIHVAPNQDIENYISRFRHMLPDSAVIVSGRSSQLKYDAFSASRVALCTSGTVAVELQLARLPCVVAYQAHFLTELFVRYKAKISYMSLPNILSASPVIPEALFRDCNPQTLASLLRKLICDDEFRQKQVLSAEKFMRLLYPPERTISLLREGKDSKSLQYSPSMLAASTILSRLEEQ